MTTARVSVTVQEYSGLPEAGVQLTEAAADASNGNRFKNIAGDVMFFVRNSGASTRTVTFSYTRRGQTVTQAPVNVLAGKTEVFGPFASEFGDHPSADGAVADVYVTCSHAECLISALKLAGLARQP